MSEAVPLAAAPGGTPKGGAFGVLLSFFVGAYLGLLQFSYFFLLEAFLSSRSASFFLALFFWLAGILAGLRPRSRRAFPLLLILAGLSYYAALVLVRAFPYQWRVLPAVALCLTVSGALGGSFFPYAKVYFTRIKMLFFHENNGFILGIVLALLGSVFAGRTLLALGPAVGLLPAAAAFFAAIRRG